LKGVKF